jgi:hypothetical protein
VSPGGLSWSICWRLRNPLSFTESPALLLAGLVHLLVRLSARTGRRARGKGNRGEAAKRGNNPCAACLLVFMRDCSVHVKRGLPTCRLEMKLARMHFNTLSLLSRRPLGVANARRTILWRGWFLWMYEIGELRLNERTNDPSSPGKNSHLCSGNVGERVWSLMDVEASY